MTNPTLIGLTGFAQSGKDYVAGQLFDYLQSVYGIIAPIIHFADPVKEISHAVFPLADPDKTNIRTRKMYQEMGSLLRYHLGPNVFVNALDESVYDTPDTQFYLVPDVRYPEEFSYIFNQNPLNYVIHVEKPGNEPVNMHISEVAHLAMKLPTGQYFHPHIINLQNDGSSMLPIFERITQKIFTT